MKIKQLIQELKEMEEEHGNLEVTTDNPHKKERVDTIKWENYIGNEDVITIRKSVLFP